MSKSLANRFWKKVEITNLVDCWHWTASTNSLGYGRIKVNRKNQYATRIAWMLTYGDIPENQCVCHKCDNPICVNPNHLFLGTKHENLIDMVRKGRAGRILTKEQVLSMRSLHSDGISCKALSYQFNTEISHIYRIIKKERWKYI